MAFKGLRKSRSESVEGLGLTEVSKKDRKDSL